MRSLIRPGLGLLALLLLTSAASAELKIYPTDGQVVGVVEADQPGKWLVLTFDRETLVITFLSTRVYEDGELCLWQGSPGSYAVVFDAEDGSRETTNVVLGGPSPKPPPDPPPGPDPPVIPEGIWGLTKAAYDNAIKMPPSAKIQLAAIAENYAYIVGAINDRSITAPQEAREKLRTLNHDAVPESERAAHAVWDSPIQKILIKNNEVLNSDMSWIASAYGAIGNGLQLASEKK